MSRSRAHETICESRSTESTAPVGLPGLFNHTIDASSTLSTSSVATTRAPATVAPTAYVGYATSGMTTVSERPMFKPVGSHATISFDPIVGRKPTSVAPVRRASHCVQASRNSGSPAVVG